ncbi:sigma-70 family RNA polymerase sigma factor [Sphingomonas swuensis]|uniref:Sigma-70 family RNA polymerase sigma factor n=1 Tax=Sphingomonas swuensis TaxID=977800 RepID=A0ABP7T0L0_9SPHN
MASGDRDALHLLMDRTGAKLFAICLRILGDEAEAEDAVQEVFVSVWHRAGSFDATRASPISWLSAIARNRAIDRLRSSRRVRESASIEAAAHVADDRPDPHALALAGDEARRLYLCMDGLEDRQRGAIRSAFFEGLSYPELAERTSVPLGTMKSWIRRGLQQLKACLDG